jgi:single-stranded DNA-binding protein
MNRINLIGSIERTIEVREVRAGRTYGRTVLAVPRMRDGRTVGIDWIPIVLRGQQVRNAARFLRPGSKVAITGHLHGRYRLRPAARNGGMVKRLLLIVVVDQITYLSLRPTDALFGSEARS